MLRKQSRITLVIDATIGAGARHAIQTLTEAAQVHNLSVRQVPSLSAASTGDWVILCGLPDSPTVREAAEALAHALPTGREALLIQPLSPDGPAGWLVTGSDDRGLMYALLDLADRLRGVANMTELWSKGYAAAEAPAVRERSLSIYTMQKADFERRFFDPAYWDRYLDGLAQARFNTFTLILGYENAGYFAPPYPYFFDVPGFPDVHVVGFTPEMKTRYLTALNRLIAQVHDRGLDFVLAIWDHIYRAGVQSGGVDAAADHALPWRVTGLTQENLMAYSVAAMDKLLEQVPGLDGLQFRMHNESGLAEAEMGVFWAKIYDVIMARAPYLRFDARAKEFPDALIDLALEKGVKIRLCTKYWMEQMGLPFHPTHIHPQNQHDRRHGYADLLRYPRRYSMLWRLWNGGTSRVLLWGDPDYVRRFAESTHLYDGDGFDVNEPLATKMAAHDHDAPPFELLNPTYRHYDWEFERYWHFYQVFGRVSYNPATPTEVWEQDFARHFGAEVGPHVMRGLHLASRILPRIVAYTYPYTLFPTTRGWVEKEHMGDLPTYVAALPSDTAQFLSIDEEARNQMEGKTSAKIRPQATAAWFEQVAQEVLAEVAQAEAAAGASPGAELIVTLTDLRILAHLARYHARRAYAGVQFALFQKSGDLHALDAAIQHERRAAGIWEELVAAAGDVYADDLMMGLESAGLSGHWRDELAALHQGLCDLEAQRDAFMPPESATSPWIAHIPVRRAKPGEAVTIKATVARQRVSHVVQLCYAASQDPPHCAPLETQDGLRYRGILPGTAVLPGLRYFLEVRAADGSLTTYPTGKPEDTISVIVTHDDRPPDVSHTPVSQVRVGEPLVLRATVWDASGVASVHVRYRSVTQVEDYRTRTMAPTDEQDVYEVTIPAGELDAGWDFMYFLEAIDTVGNGTCYPDLETETPYIITRLLRA